MILVSILGLGSLFKVQPDLFELTFGLSMIMELFFCDLVQFRTGAKKIKFYGLRLTFGLRVITGTILRPRLIFWAWAHF